MGTHMKITIHLSDALLAAAKRHTAKHGITLRALIEQSLAHTLREKSPPDAFKLRDASVDGEGLTEAARALSSSAWRDMANGSGNPRH
jgi:hypothetical protein